MIAITMRIRPTGRAPNPAKKHEHIELSAGTGARSHRSAGKSVDNTAIPDPITMSPFFHKLMVGV
jgi:hypothetical protein